MGIHNRHPGFTLNDKKRLEELYFEKKISIKNIASMEKCDFKKLKSAFIELGIKLKSPKEHINEWSPNYWTQERKQIHSLKQKGKLRRTLDYYIPLFKQIHNNYYDYSNTIYKGSKVKIEIICPKHRFFLATSK